MRHTEKTDKNMKTQISSLINGRANVVRDISCEKYAGVDELVGSSTEERAEITRKVIEENPDGMDIEVKGVRLHLDRYASCSGKTVWYKANLTREQYISIAGNDFPDNRLQWYAAIDIAMDMRVSVMRFSRRNERATWRQKQSIILDESFVKIL